MALHVLLRDSLTLLMDFRASEETRLRASTASYEDNFICRQCSYLTGNTTKGLQGVLRV
jgi:hypothetical protein